LQQVSRPREIDRPPTQPKETTMNSFASNLYRDLTCAARRPYHLVFSLSSVQSSRPRGTHSGASRTVASSRITPGLPARAGRFGRLVG